MLTWFSSIGNWTNCTKLTGDKQGTPSGLTPCTAPQVIIQNKLPTIHICLSPSLSLGSSALSSASSELGYSTTMATVLETFTLPRCSALRSRALSPMVSSLASSPAARLGLPQFRGLKVVPTRSAGSVSSGSSSRVARRRGAIVCEAQETAVVGQYRKLYISRLLVHCRFF